MLNIKSDSLAEIQNMWIFGKKMPRIDPAKLLHTLSQLLSPQGGIKSAEEVTTLIEINWQKANNQIDYFYHHYFHSHYVGFITCDSLVQWCVFFTRCPALWNWCKSSLRSWSQNASTYTFWGLQKWTCWNSSCSRRGGTCWTIGEPFVWSITRAHRNIKTCNILLTNVHSNQVPGFYRDGQLVPVRRPGEVVCSLPHEPRQVEGECWSQSGEAIHKLKYKPYLNLNI